MTNKHFIKLGATVRCTYRTPNFYAAICKGYGPIPYDEEERIATVIGKPRDIDTKRFVSLWGYIYEDETEVLVRDEKGREFYVSLEYVEPYAEIEDLTFDELKELRSQISAGSIYLSDYENSFGVDENIVMCLCDGYLEWLYEMFGEELADENDTPENFAHYVAA